MTEETNEEKQKRLNKKLEIVRAQYAKGLETLQGLDAP